MHNTWIDVHGAGAQRSNPADYPTGHGPQGDAIRIYNYVRLVRNGAEFVEGADSGADAVAVVMSSKVVQPHRLSQNKKALEQLTPSS